MSQPHASTSRRADCTPQELKDRLDRGETPLVIDVREADELALAAIPGVLHIPMGEIPGRLTELERHADREIIVLCHHGVRSGNVQRFLLHHGFEQVRNLVGGIDAYSRLADPSVPRY